MKNNNTRPVFLDLTRIHMPVTAVISIAHRLAGVLMFVAIPFMIYLFELSLQDAQGYQRVHQLFENGLMRLVLMLLLWCLAHHLFAGIRYLLIDIDVGLESAAARKSARLVIFSGLVVLFGGSLLLL